MPAAKGDKHCKAKLTAEQVRGIRDLYAQGTYQTILAELYEVSQTTISQIVRRITYTEV